MNIQRDSNKTTIKFGLKGDSDKAQSLYKFAGKTVRLVVQASQMSIEEFYEEEENHEGIKYKVDKNGNVEVPDKDQMTLDDVEEPLAID